MVGANFFFAGCCGNEKRLYICSVETVRQLKTTTMSNTTNIIGTTEEVTTCGCCGKSGLKKTVVIEVDGTEILYYGTVCASYAMGQDVKKVNETVAAIESENKLIEKFKTLNGDIAKGKLIRQARKTGMALDRLFTLFGNVEYAMSNRVMYSIGVYTHEITTA